MSHPEKTGNKMKKFFCYLYLAIITISPVTSANVLNEFQQHLNTLKGNVIYLDFWASWCVPCRKSFPWMNEMQSKYLDKGFVVFSVNLDAEKSYAEQFLTEVPASFDVFYDPKGNVAKKFKLKGMPSSFLIDRQGNIISSHVGFNDDKKARYQREIEQMFAQ